MQQRVNSPPVDTELFGFNTAQQVEQFWETSIDSLQKFNEKENFESVLKNVLTVKNRISHSLAKTEKNEKVFEWIIQGINSIQKYNFSSKGTFSLEKEIQCNTQNCLKILEVLGKAIEVYYSKPHSDDELRKIKSQLKNNLELLKKSCLGEIQLPGLLGENKEDQDITAELEEFKLSEEVIPSSPESKIFEHSPCKAKRKSIFGNSLSERRDSKNLRSEFFKNLEETNEIAGNRRKSKSPTKSILRKLDPELANQIEECKNGGLLDTTDCDFKIKKPFSPRKRKCRINPIDDDTQSVLSTTTRNTDGTFGKATPRLSENEDRRYTTRFSIREDKRLFGPRIKICEGKNTVKNFYKRRNITTDFEFNPRFDEPRKMKKRAKVALPASKRDPTFHMRLRKRQIKACEVKVREIQKQTPGILKPDPLKNRFW